MPTAMRLVLCTWSRRALLQARRDQVQSTSRMAVGMVAVYKALGGGIPAAPGTPG